MEASQQLMFALQSPVGLRFGATLQVDADRITFEMDLKIPKGTQCSFRMELSGEDDTIMGTVRIERALPARGGGLPRYQCKIVEMSIDDRTRFDSWRRDIATGGVSRRIERDPEQLRAQISTKMVGGATEAESRAVLERLNAKRSSRRKEEGYVEGDPLGLASEKEKATAPDKAGLREKLREEKPVEVEDSQRKAEQEKAEKARTAIVEELSVPEPDAPSWLPNQDDAPAECTKPVVQQVTPSVVSPKTTPAPLPVVPPKTTSTPVPVAPSAPATVSPMVAPAPVASSVSPPLIVVDSDSTPIGVTMIYLSRESFTQDYDATFHTSAVTIDHSELTDLYHSVQLKLQFEDGDSITVMGQMVAQLPNGMAIALELDAEQRQKLKVRAGR